MQGRGWEVARGSASTPSRGPRAAGLVCDGALQVSHPPGRSRRPEIATRQRVAPAAICLAWILAHTSTQFLSPAPAESLTSGTICAVDVHLDADALAQLDAIVS
jgi:hypothetical protein